MKLLNTVRKLLLWQPECEKHRFYLPGCCACSLRMEYKQKVKEQESE